MRFNAFSMVCAAMLSLAALSACTSSASSQSAAPTASAPPAPPPPPPPPPPPAETATPAPATATPTASGPSAVPAPSADSKATVNGNSIRIPGNIEFETGKATFKPGSNSEQSLDQLKQFLEANPRVTKLRIEGHTDNVGSAPANEQLSGERALAIKKYLVDKGVSKARLIAVGFGQSKPVADNATEEGRTKNRRTEFRIAELSGKPYLGKDPTGGGKVFDF